MARRTGRYRRRGLQANGATLPEALAGTQPTDADKQVAKSLASGERRLVLLGNGAVRHPDFAAIHAAAQWIADATGATLGFLTEAANTVGAHLVNALPGEGGLNAREAFEQPRKGYVLLNVEPEFDTANPAQALAALKQAEMVVVMSPFQTGAEYADVLLPIAPFTETAGTFVNAEGTVQTFNGVVRPLGDTRPAWKVLRVLGSLLGASGFGIRYRGRSTRRSPRRRRIEVASVEQDGCCGCTRQVGEGREGKFERIADVPIYHADALVRRAESLHLTAAARTANSVGLPAALFDKLGLKEGDAVRVRRGEQSVQLPAVRDANLAETVVRVSAATPAGAALGSLFGELVVEKA